MTESPFDVNTLHDELKAFEDEVLRLKNLLKEWDQELLPSAHRQSFIDTQATPSEWMHTALDAADDNISSSKA